MEFGTVQTTELERYLNQPATLVLDIRPHAAYSAARIPHAVSLSVPSTLLKRPLFSLQRIAAMLPSPAARTRFSAWPAAAAVLVYDADSSTLPESSNIAGLLRKFKSDGFKGDLLWLKGGFQAVWRERPHIVDTLPDSPDAEPDDDDDDPAKPSILRPRHLPMAAFSLSSTTVHNSPIKRLPNPQAHFTAHTATALAHPAFNPFFDTIRQNTELSHGITERIPLRLPRRVRRRIHELPFPWLQDVARHAAHAPHPPKSFTESSSESEGDSDDSANPADIEQGKEALAMQFFKIELSEQRRLMGIMEHHSKESSHVSEHSSRPRTSVPFPYSITAGIEKGAKNRYRHIWPFEHARVRLHQKKDADDDYVNASYIQPLGTNRRYIATQGPLSATFTDFWTLCWEQNVHVIVMLTREVEGAMVKCGSYWTDTVFGPLRLRLISKEGYSPSDEYASTAGFFDQSAVISASAMRSPRKHFPRSTGSQVHHRHYHNKQSETIKRVFELSHTGYPESKPRKIIHFQYLEWPDLNVPDDPRGVLGLIKQVEEAVNETGSDGQPSDPKKRRRVASQVSLSEVDDKTGIAKHALGKNSPVLLHCSAGVGRTGGFIAIDAILDAIRREVRSKNPARSPPDDAMDIDHQSQANTMDVASVNAVPLAMSSGTEGGKTVHSDQVLTVHVLVATPMPVDQPDSAGSDDPSSANVSMTRQWAENVRDETGIDGAHSSHQRSNSQDENVSSNSSVSLSVPESSNLGASSIDTGMSTPGGDYSNSSSSAGTSVSGISSTSKAKFPSVLADELRQAVLQSQQTAIEHRLRTVSAPIMNANLSFGRGRPPRLDDATNSSGFIAYPPLKIRQENTNDQDGSRKPSTLFFDFSDASPFKLKPLSHNLGGLSSEGEIPSRSQSPSADEATRQPSQSVPIWPSAAEESHLAPQSKSFDYKEPRPLHEDFTPPPLTSFEDPIWEVVHDMREQRMSLCQSLRQYVFVHAAIIEGALMVVDEEKEIAAGLRPRTVYPEASREASTTPYQVHRQPVHPYDTTSVASTSSLSLGKRGASPMELNKESKQGDVLLSKRPSIKRKQRSGDELIDDECYYPLSARIPPSVAHAGNTGVSPVVMTS